MHLSKSDFILASDCPKKLVYKKAYYPTTNDVNEYMQMLSQGGYVVGEMATRYYPNGIEIDGPQQQCINLTEQYLDQNIDVVLFEAAIYSNQKIVRVDILEKSGNDLHIIEVKSKSFDSSASDKDIQKDLKKKIDDVAYQYFVLKEKYPTANIKASLFMPDKAKITTIDQLAGWFYLKPDEDGEPDSEALPAQGKPRFRKPEVIFKYQDDPEKDKYLDRLKNEGILSLYDVTDLVVTMQTETARLANTFIEILNNGINPDQSRINKNCKGCEFKTDGEKLNGYKECWGKLADPNPHIFDLYYGGAKKTLDKTFLLDELISAGKTSLYDIKVEDLQNKDGELTSRGERQWLQIEKTKSNTEWISDSLKTEIDQLTYPLHFIDFETYTGAVPFHKGMRPYELIAFQWSCHTIKTKGATPQHKEFIHIGPEFPNFMFAQALMECIGDSGTPLMWATHENTVLRTIYYQMESFGYSNPKLKSWLEGIIKDEDMGFEGRLVDMNKMTLEHYFHPYMKGRTSIKKVLPAIWSHNQYLHEVPHFKDYSPDKLDDQIIDPYDTLVAKFQDDDEMSVGTGTDAMRAYYRLRFDPSLGPEQMLTIKNHLLEYCKLDTLAMVIIGYHWGMR